MPSELGSNRPASLHCPENRSDPPIIPDARIARGEPSRTLPLACALVLATLLPPAPTAQILPRDDPADHPAIVAAAEQQQSRRDRWLSLAFAAGVRI